VSKYIKIFSICGALLYLSGGVWTAYCFKVAVCPNISLAGEAYLTTTWPLWFKAIPTSKYMPVYDWCFDNEKDAQND